MLTLSAIAKSNTTKASPKVATHIVVIIVRMLAHSLQASANADTRIARRTYYWGIVYSDTVPTTQEHAMVVYRWAFH